jgi:sterol desaturase/sphingolipid hydroxylase (fatty acid hydroxylase superfamily)
MDLPPVLVAAGESIWRLLNWIGSLILGSSFKGDPDFSLAEFLVSRKGLIIIGVTALELFFPLEERRFGRRNFLTFTYFMLAAKTGVFILIVIPLIQDLWVKYGLPSLDLDLAMHPALYWVVALLVVNFVDYWSHRLMHRIPLLWHIHKIHHATVHLNWGSNYHRHFAMAIVSAPLVTVTTLLLGTHLVPPFGAVHMLVEHLQHANIRLRFGWLNYILALPEVHRYHHSTDPRYYDKNFAGGFVIWDQIFGTYVYDAKKPVYEFGLDEPVPTGYIGQQVAPLVWIAKDIAKKIPHARVRAWGNRPYAKGLTAKEQRALVPVALNTGEETVAARQLTTH